MTDEYSKTRVYQWSTSFDSSFYSFYLRERARWGGLPVDHSMSYNSSVVLIVTELAKKLPIFIEHVFIPMFNNSQINSNLSHFSRIHILSSYISFRYILILSSLEIPQFKLLHAFLISPYVLVVSPVWSFLIQSI
jgi:hypothetical protein